MNRFLSGNEYMKLDELCEEMYISKTSMSMIMQEIRGILKGYNLTITSKPYYGLLVKGKEVNKRICLTDLYLKRGCDLYEDDYLGLVEAVNQSNYLKFEQEFRSVLRLNDYELSEQSMQWILTYLYFVALRIQKGFSVKKEESNVQEIKLSEKEFLFSKQLLELYLQLFHLKNISEEEIVSFGEQLASRRIIRKFDEKSNCDHDNLELSIVDEILTCFKETMQIDLSKDEEFITNLSLHLIAVKKRVDCGVHISNPVLRVVVQESTFAYELSLIAVAIINKKFHCTLDENEIGFIALHIETSLDRNRRADLYNVLYITNTGRAIVQMNKQSILKNFSHQINTLKSINQNFLSREDFDGIDFIITSSKIKMDTKIPVVSVSVLIQQADLDKIRNFMEVEMKKEDVMQYFNPNLFFADVHLKTKQEVLKFMSAKIKEVEKIDMDYYDSLLIREQMGSTEFGNLLALPHTHEPKSEKSFVCILILDKPIVWTKQQVQLVILVSLKKEHNMPQDQFYFAIRNLLESKNMRILIKEKSFKTLERIMNNKEKS